MGGRDTTISMDGKTKIKAIITIAAVAYGWAGVMMQFR